MMKDKSYNSILNDESNILLTCEHASPVIPDKYKSLGLSKSELDGAKDLYDIGSREVTSYLEKNMEASALYAGVSRLVIDYNRRLDAQNKFENTFHTCSLKTELLVEEAGVENLITIPGNSFNENEFFCEEKRRYEKYAIPYIEKAHDMVNQLKKRHEKTYIVQIHSFFPYYNGEERTVDIGVLYDKARHCGERIVNEMQTNTNLCVAGNEPWSMNDVDRIIFEEIEEVNNVEIVAFDVNNKHLTNNEGIQQISELIMNALKSELNA